MERSPVVIVLAAGKGTRFQASGGTIHKLKVPLDGTPVLQHVIKAVEVARLPWRMVTHVRGEGMADSIAAGVSATADAEGWLILPGDLPLIRPESLLSVARGLHSHTVVVPHWGRQRGHPVGFRKECFKSLAGLSGGEGAASVVDQHRLSNNVLDLILEDIGVVTDIDTVDDLIRAEALLHGRSSMEETNGEH